MDLREGEEEEEDLLDETTLRFRCTRPSALRAAAETLEIFPIAV